MKEQNNASFYERTPSYNDSSSLMLRLDTQTLINSIEAFLKGGQLVYEVDPETNQLKTRVVNYGTPKANDKGIQAIMGWTTFIINNHVVQGNFPLENKVKGYSPMYENFIYNLRIELGQDLIINAPEWGLKDEEIQGIIDRLMLFAEAFMSRLIGNEERNSYGTSLRSNEVSTNTSRGGAMPGIFKS